MAMRAPFLLPAFAAFVLLAQMAVAPPGGNWRERALDYADSVQMFGSIQNATFLYSGSFVRFQFDESTSTITDYIVLTPSRSTSVFRSISSDISGAGVPSTNGSLFEYVSPAFLILAHNNPTSALVITSGPAALNVTFTLSGGVDASRYGTTLNLTTPDLTGYLSVKSPATLTLNGSQALAYLPPGSSVMFRANAMAGEGVAGSNGQEPLVNATIQHQLALESFEIGFEGYAEASDVEYGGARRIGTDVGTGRVSVALEMSAASANLVALHMHNSALAVDNDTRLTVSLYGTAVSQLSSLDAVVARTGDTPAFAFLVGNGGLLLLAYLPGTGNQTLSIQLVVPPEQPPALNPIQLLAIGVIVVVLLGVAAAVMLRRKPAV